MYTVGTKQFKSLNRAIAYFIEHTDTQNVLGAYGTIMCERLPDNTLYTCNYVATKPLMLAWLKVYEHDNNRPKLIISNTMVG